MLKSSAKDRQLVSRLKLVRLSVLALLVGFVSLSCQKQQEEPATTTVLASIGDFEVSETHFLNSFRRYFERSGRSLQVTEPLKRSILENELGIYTAVKFAKDNGWDTDFAGERRLEKISRQVWMEEYERRMLHDEFELTEEDLMELYYRYNTHVRASHLFSTDRFTIDSLYQLLQSGHDFAELAAQNFESKRLRESGGDLGYFTVDEMDVAFEQAAFRLDIGEISRPVRTSRGYSIIKVTDVITNPFLRETDFAVKKPRLRSLANKQHGELMRRKDIYNKVSDFNINQQVLKDVWSHVENDVRLPVTGVLEEASFVNIPPELGNQKVADSDDLTLTVNELLFELYYTPDEARSGLDSYYRFLQFAEGLAYRVYAINTVQNNNRADLAFVEGSIERTFHIYLSNRLNEYLKANISIPEEVIREEFDTYRDVYQHPVELNLAEIIMDDWDVAEIAWNELQMGRDFLDVLEQYGFDEEAKEFGGELGFVPINNFGGLAPALSNKQPGDYAGPFEVQKDIIFIFKVLGRREARPMTFEEARETIEEQLAMNELERERARILAETRRKHNATINYAKLSEVTLSL